MLMIGDSAGLESRCEEPLAEEFYADNTPYRSRADTRCSVNALYYFTERCLTSGLSNTLSSNDASVEYCLLTPSNKDIPVRRSSTRCELLGLAATLALFSSCVFTARSSGQDVTSHGAATDAARMTSDDAAVTAMQNVLARSGGAAAWEGTKSARETFNIKAASGADGEVAQHFLDDWSTEVTRYRRIRSNAGVAPEDHNGSPSFSASIGGRQVPIPEFDQARVVADRLPAAAAQIMLGNHNYVLKIARSRPCDSGSICVDVFEKQRFGPSSAPEQQWTISTSTGLPTSVAIAGFVIGPAQASHWRVVHYLQYENRQNLTLPVSLRVDGPTGRTTAWTLVSFTPNSGFDTMKFDQEVTR